MALTFANPTTEYKGTRKETLTLVTADNSYPAGGWSVTPAALGQTTVSQVTIDPVGGFTFAYDYTNEKVQAYWVDTSTDGAALAEVTDLSSALDTLVLRIRTRS